MPSLSSDIHSQEKMFSYWINSGLSQIKPSPISNLFSFPSENDQIMIVIVRMELCKVSDFAEYIILGSCLFKNL